MLFDVFDEKTLLHQINFLLTTYIYNHLYVTVVERVQKINTSYLHLIHLGLLNWDWAPIRVQHTLGLVPPRPKLWQLSPMRGCEVDSRRIQHPMWPHLRVYIYLYMHVNYIYIHIYPSIESCCVAVYLWLSLFTSDHCILLYIVLFFLSLLIFSCPCLSYNRIFFPIFSYLIVSMYLCIYRSI